MFLLADVPVFEDSSKRDTTTGQVDDLGRLNQLIAALIGATINVPVWYAIEKLPEVSPAAVRLWAPASSEP